MDSGRIGSELILSAAGRPGQPRRRDEKEMIGPEPERPGGWTRRKRRQTAAITSAPFCPPNPKLVDSPYRTRPSRAVFGM